MKLGKQTNKQTGKMSNRLKGNSCHCGNLEQQYIELQKNTF